MQIVTIVPQDQPSKLKGEKMIASVHNYGGHILELLLKYAP